MHRKTKHFNLIRVSRSCPGILKKLDSCSRETDNKSTFLSLPPTTPNDLRIKKKKKKDLSRTKENYNLRFILCMDCFSDQIIVSNYLTKVKVSNITEIFFNVDT